MSLRLDVETLHHALPGKIVDNNGITAVRPAHMNGQFPPVQRYRLNSFTWPHDQFYRFFRAHKSRLKSTCPIDQCVDEKRKTRYDHQAHHVNGDLEKDKPGRVPCRQVIII